jgi:hypothetical protein
MKNQFISECIDLMKKEEIKDELRNFIRPLLDTLIQDIYPYIYISILLVFVSFFLILAIFYLLLRSKKFSY